jgi:hypothetical protein
VARIISAREVRIESANRRRKSFLSAVAANAIRGAAARARVSAAIVSDSTMFPKIYIDDDQI